MRNKIYILMFIVAALFASCDSQLNEVPSKQQDIIPKKVSYLEAFLSNDDYKGVRMRPLLVMGDDFTPVKTLQERSNRIYTGDKLQLPLAWAIEDMLNYVGGDDLWSNEYKKIYIANTILDYIPEVAGTDAEKKRLSGDAHLMRAYSHFILTSTYGLPYKADGSNSDDLGTILQKFPSLTNYVDRSTLEECYTFILEDLEAAEEELADIDLAVAPVGNIAQWRASAPAVYGLMAKVYLTMGNYEQAQIYAQKALDNNGVAELVDFNTEMTYANEFVNDTASIYKTEGEATFVEIKYPMTKNSDFEIYDWKESYFRRNVDLPQAWLVPSDGLVAAYGANKTDREYDLRWKYFFVDNYSYSNAAFRGSGEGDDFIPADSIAAYQGLDIIGPSVPEMYLIKAECQARIGSYSNAQTTINELRAKRISADAPANIRDLSFSSKEDAIQKILDERRREMPFFARWYDLKRLAANGEFGYIPTTIERDFFEVSGAAVSTTPETYTFSPQADYKKFAYPIPKKDIDAAAKLGATITQNNY